MRIWYTKHMKFRVGESRAFTIVELLIVIVVIAILAAITVVAYTGIQQRAKESSLQSTVQQFAKRLEASKIESPTSTYPASISELGASVPSSIAYSVSVSGAGYCLVAVDGSISYYATNSQMQPQAGSCVTADGLAGWWPFNGDAQDVSGSGNHAVVNGQTISTGQNGRPSGAYVFNGVSAMTAGMNNIPIGSSDRTVTAWVNLSSYAASPGWSMVSSWGAQSTSAASALSIRYTGAVAFNGQSNDAISGMIMPLNGWHLVGYTVSGTQVKIIYDDTIASYALANSLSTNASAQSYIGSYIGNNRWTGSIDDLRIYNRVLSNAELQAIYAAGAV